MKMFNALFLLISLVRAEVVTAKFRNASFDINPIPVNQLSCQKMLIQMIQSFHTEEMYLSRLLMAVTNIGQHQFYEVAEQQRDKAAIAKIISEFNLMIDRPKNDSTPLYAFTDKVNQKTYLLPHFHQLNEDEQAQIIWGEGYWLLNPYTKFEEIIKAREAFELYVKGKREDRLELGLPRLVGGLIGDPTFSARTAYAFEKRNSEDKTISIKDLFVDLNKFCKARELEQKYGALFYDVYCYLDSKNLSAFLRVIPQDSLFHQELIHYLATASNARIYISQTGTVPIDFIFERPARIPSNAIEQFGKIRVNPLTMNFTGLF